MTIEEMQDNVLKKYGHEDSCTIWFFKISEEPILHNLGKKEVKVIHNYLMRG